MTRLEAKGFCSEACKPASPEQYCASAEARGGRKDPLLKSWFLTSTKTLACMCSLSHTCMHNKQTDKSKKLWPEGCHNWEQSIKIWNFPINCLPNIISLNLHNICSFIWRHQLFKQWCSMFEDINSQELRQSEFSRLGLVLLLSVV